MSKRAAEFYVRTIGKLWGMETVVLRVFNAYGPGQSLPAAHAPVIPRYLKRAISGGSVVVFGDGNQTRDYVYVTDVVNALVAAATATRVDRQIINVGSGKVTAMEEIAKAIGSEVIFIPRRAFEVERHQADISRAEALLDWHPKKNVIEWLHEFVPTLKSVREVIDK